MTLPRERSNLQSLDKTLQGWTLRFFIRCVFAYIPAFPPPYLHIESDQILEGMRLSSVHCV